MTERRVEVSFGTEPFSLQGIGELFVRLGGADDGDLVRIARRMDVPVDGYHVKAIADVLGLSDEPRELPELYSSVRRLLEIAAAEGPLTVVFRDVEAAGPAFFNLLAYLEDALQVPVALETERGGSEPQWPKDPVTLREKGLRSLRRSDMPAAHEYLLRAAHFFGPGPERLSCVAAACDALLAGDRPADALHLARTGLEEASRAKDAAHSARFRFFVILLGEDEPADLRGDLEGISQALAEGSDLSGAAQATEALAHLEAETSGRSQAMPLMERALELAKDGGDTQTMTRVAAWLCDSLSDIPTADARARVDDLSWIDERSPLVRVKRLVTSARLHASNDAMEQARMDLLHAMELQEDLGQPRWVTGIPESGRVEDL